MNPNDKSDDSQAGAAGKQGDNIRDSAQQIWLAGLGAFAKAQQEGAKAFESLVKEGVGMQKRTQTAAEEGLAQAQAKMSGFANQFGSIGSRATGQWGKLEGIFEERVARALEKLGVPSATSVAALNARVEALSAEVEALRAIVGTKAGSSAGTPRARRSSTTRATGAGRGSAKDTSSEPAGTARRRSQKT